tara:strand:+ start:1406 stop:1651 length:246 start_codon:yes stop_codon:yes gene_type:complete
MNLKKMIVAKATEVAEQQADAVKDELLEYIKSDEVEILIAEWMDKAINIPFTSDEKEAPIFRDVADIVQKVIAMVISGAKI